MKKRAWREQSDSESVTFSLRFQMADGWRALSAGVGGGSSGFAQAVFGHTNLGQTALAGLATVLVVYTAGGMFAQTRIRLNRHLLTVTMGLRKRARLRLPITEIEHFAVGKAPGRWVSIEAILRDGSNQSFELYLRQREQADALVARLDAALLQVRAPGRYRD